MWDVKTSLQKQGSDLVIRVGMLGQVVKELLDSFNKAGEIEVTGIWMTGEEGVEEKREEREVRRVAEGGGKEFKLWADEKYFIDEYVLSSTSMPHH